MHPFSKSLAKSTVSLTTIDPLSDSNELQAIEDGLENFVRSMESMDSKVNELAQVIWIAR